MISKFTRWSLALAVVAGGSVLAFAARSPARPAASSGFGFDPFTKTTITTDDSAKVVVTGVSRRLVEPPFRPQTKSPYRRPPVTPPAP